MIPRVAIRGHSFKSCGDYYLHDKKADTKERVGWTHTHNLPTQDAEKAMKVMAYTAMHSDDLKRNVGIPLTGRKSKLGEVYSFSLAWNPEQEPSKEEMLNSSYDTLEKLGLSDHQSVMVYHQETDHPHVHVICNLVHPQSGKMAKIYNDYLVFSEWAEKKEKEDGKIYCEERVINNKIRNGIEPEQQELSKRNQKREEKRQRRILVQDLYNQSDSGKAFASALELNDLTLAEGDRRGYVLVDKAGEIHSVSRQLKGIKNSDLKARLSDLDILPLASDLSLDRKHFDRDRYEIEWQKDIVDSAIESSGQKKNSQNTNQLNKDKVQEDGVRLEDVNLRQMLIKNIEHEKSLKLLDYDRENRHKISRARKEFEESIQIENSKEELEMLNERLEKTRGVFTKKKREQLAERIEQVQREIEESQKRIDEQLAKVRRDYDNERAEYIKNDLSFDIDERMKEIKKWRAEQLNDFNVSNKDKNDIDPPELLI